MPCAASDTLCLPAVRHSCSSIGEADAAGCCPGGIIGTQLSGAASSLLQFNHTSPRALHNNYFPCALSAIAAELRAVGMEAAASERTPPGPALTRHALFRHAMRLVTVSAQMNVSFGLTLALLLALHCSL